MQQEQEHIKEKYLVLCQMNISLPSSPFYLNDPPSMFPPLAFFSLSIQPKHTKFLYIF